MVISFHRKDNGKTKQKKIDQLKLVVGRKGSHKHTHRKEEVTLSFIRKFADDNG